MGVFKTSGLSEVWSDFLFIWYAHSYEHTETPEAPNDEKSVPHWAQVLGIRSGPLG